MVALASMYVVKFIWFISPLPLASQQQQRHVAIGFHSGKLQLTWGISIQSTVRNNLARCSLSQRNLGLTISNPFFMWRIRVHSGETRSIAMALASERRVRSHKKAGPFRWLFSNVAGPWRNKQPEWKKIELALGGEKKNRTLQTAQRADYEPKSSTFIMKIYVNPILFWSFSMRLQFLWNFCTT